jgi:hypothetical protein
MKQYLTPEQTDKLIELGFEKPKSCSGFSIDETKDAVFYYDYSIGELIEMLPKAIGDDYLDISSPYGEDDDWLVAYGQLLYDEWEALYTFLNKELIDAFYDMILKLKEDGVI